MRKSCLTLSRRLPAQGCDNRTDREAVVMFAKSRRSVRSVASFPHRAVCAPGDAEDCGLDQTSRKLSMVGIDTARIHGTDYQAHARHLAHSPPHFPRTAFSAEAAKQRAKQDRSRFHPLIVLSWPGTAAKRCHLGGQLGAVQPTFKSGVDLMIASEFSEV